MNGSGAVVVWEWESQPRIWVPYTADVCQYIESEFRRQCQKVDLGGQNTVELVGCEIDFSLMKQVNAFTNDCAKVRRQTYPSDCPLANGVHWKWFADYRWQFYDVETSNYIEDAFQNKRSKVSLRRSPIRIPNTIYFSSMQQVNKTTKFRRKIERIETKDQYPQANYETTNMNGQHGLSQGSNSISPSVSTTVITHSNLTSPISPNTRTPNPLAPTSAGTSVSRNSIMQTGLGTRNSPFHPVRPTVNSSTNPIHYLNAPTGSSVVHRGNVNGLTMHNTVPLHHMGSGIPLSGHTPSSGLSRLQSNAGSSNYGACFLGSSNQASASAAAASTQTGSVPTRKRQRGASASSPVPRSTRPITGPLGDFARSVHTGTTLDDECAICLESLSTPSDYDNDPNADVQCTSADVLELIKCKHMFHRICLKRLHESGTSQNGCLRCPTCKTIHGILKGNQPDSGSMSVTTNSKDIPGYPGYGSIIITYNFTSGIQGPNHPNPGQQYYPNAFPRTCYLPNNDKGKKVLKLLKIAFERQLVFTVGRSVTTGQDNCIVWNDIHHKTEGYSNGSGYGYPDPNYLDNVLAELASHGVTDDA